MNANSFTYGVEIEGIFSKSLITTFQEKKISFKLRTDGSVRANDILINNDLSIDDIERNYQEINIGIFKNPTEFFDALALVGSGINHFFDKSCGLHLHIKPKRSIDNFQSSIINMDFLKKIQTFAFTNLCWHIKQRKGNNFCKPYKTLQESLSDFYEQEKYHFFRVHPVFNTIEFRFFSPCEHKSENIKTFLEYFYQEFKKVSKQRKAEVMLSEKRQEVNMTDTKVINKNSNTKVLKLTYKINERTRITKYQPYDCGKTDARYCGSISSCAYHKKFF